MSEQESLKEMIKHLKFSKRRAYALARAATTKAETYREALAFVEKQLDTVIAAKARKSMKEAGQ